MLGRDSFINVVSTPSPLVFTGGLLVSAAGVGLSIVEPRSLAVVRRLELDVARLCELAPGFVACVVKGPDAQLARVEVATGRVETLARGSSDFAALAAPDPGNLYVWDRDGVQRHELKATGLVSHSPTFSRETDPPLVEQLVALDDGRVARVHSGFLEVYRRDKLEAEPRTPGLLAAHLAPAPRSRLWISAINRGHLVLANLTDPITVEQRFDFGPGIIVSLTSAPGRAAAVVGRDDSVTPSWEVAVVSETGALLRRFPIPESFCPPRFRAFVALAGERVVICRVGDGAMLGWDL